LRPTLLVCRTIHNVDGLAFILLAKTQKIENSNLHGFELHRPSSKGTKLLLQVIKAIINQLGLTNFHNPVSNALGADCILLSFFVSFLLSWVVEIQLHHFCRDGRGQDLEK